MYPRIPRSAYYTPEFRNLLELLEEGSLENAVKSKGKAMVELLKGAK